MKKLVILTIITFNCWGADHFKEYYNCMVAKHYTIACINASQQYHMAYVSGAISKKDYDQVMLKTYITLKCVENGKKYLACAPTMDPYGYY